MAQPTLKALKFGKGIRLKNECLNNIIKSEKEKSGIMSFLKKWGKEITGTVKTVGGEYAKEISKYTGVELVGKAGEFISLSGKQDLDEAKKIDEQKKEQGVLRNIGEITGEVTGGVIGGSVKLVGKTVKSDFIENVGDGIHKSSHFSGDVVGQFVQGAFDSSQGTITADSKKRDKGLRDLGGSVKRTGSALEQTAKTTYQNGKDIITGLNEGDNDRALKGAKSLGTTVAVGVIGVSVLDGIDVVDLNGNEGNFDGGNNGGDIATGGFAMGEESQSTNQNVNGVIFEDYGVEQGEAEVSEQQYIQIENDNTHSVQPHERTLASGQTIWVDGDGDTTIDRTAEQGGGWEQSNPDYRVAEDKA